jgi:hypothetical protein
MLMTNHAPNAETPRDADLQRTQRAFLFAREQLAANRYASRYIPAIDWRQLAADLNGDRNGGHRPPNDAPESPIR